MAHKKAGGSSKNGRDSESKRLGVKKFGNEMVVPGNNVGMGKDHTLFALTGGKVHFQRKANGRTYVNVVPAEAAE